MTLKQILANKYTESKALVAFNIQSIYQIKALLDAAEAVNEYAIAQFSAKLVTSFHEVYGFPALVRKYQGKHVFFHLDHCSDTALIRQCVDFGFASVMYDGSSLALEENIRNTNSIYEYASAKDCLVEAELGAIGGVEDGFGSEQGSYFSPDELAVFANKARFDLLALAIGNAHGFYQTTEGIRPELLVNAKDIIGPCQFVLHGGTGMPEEMVMEALQAGVVKINVSTDLKRVTQQAIREYGQQHDLYDESKLNATIQAALRPFFMNYILKYTTIHVPGH